MVEIKYNDCGNIKEGKLSIVSNKLNIKYGINGVGKTTLAKSLEGFINDDKTLINKYIPFGTNDKPKVTHEQIESVLVYDQRYIKNYLYKKGDAINNTYEIAVKTADYDERNKKVNETLEELKKLANAEEINKVFKMLEETTKEIKPNKDNETLSGSSAFVKGLDLANIKNKIKEKNALEYEHLIVSSNAPNWSKWYSEGDKFITNNKCPFCLSELKENFLREYKGIVKAFNSITIRHGITTRRILNNLKIFSDDELNDQITNNQIDGKLKDETIRKIIDFTSSLNIEKVKLEQIRILNPISFFTQTKDCSWYEVLSSDFNEEKLKLKINNLMLDEEIFKRIDKESFNKVKEINLKLNEYLKDVRDLFIELRQLNTQLKNNIKKLETFVNDFLVIAGIPYKVKTKRSEESDFLTTLVPINSEDKELKTPEDSLSFGELNALSLMLFCVQAINGDYDLIILDDPVSSFDDNKKYAIIHQLFHNRNNSLRGKTVLMFTHDFSPLIDFIQLKKPAGDITVAHYVYNNQGFLKEKEITKDKIVNNFQTLKSIAENKEYNILKRIVALRNYLELTGLKTNEVDAYSILSSILHIKERPEDINNEPLSQDDINKGLYYINKYISDFDYSGIYKEITIDNFLKECYENGSSILKLITARIYLQLNPELQQNKVLWKYLSEYFHIENLNVFGLNPTEYELIPPHILDSIDELFN